LQRLHFPELLILECLGDTDLQGFDGVCDAAPVGQLPRMFRRDGRMTSTPHHIRAGQRGRGLCVLSVTDSGINCVVPHLLQVFSPANYPTEVGDLSTKIISPKLFLNNKLGSIFIPVVTTGRSLFPSSFAHRSLVGDCSLSTRARLFCDRFALGTSLGLPRSVFYTRD